MYKRQGLDFDINDYEENWKGKIGEFVFSEGSGWMYSVNNIFPNVSFSDIYLSDGDVVRVQFLSLIHIFLISVKLRRFTLNRRGVFYFPLAGREVFLRRRLNLRRFILNKDAVSVSCLYDS